PQRCASTNSATTARHEKTGRNRPAAFSKSLPAKQGHPAEYSIIVRGSMRTEDCCLTISYIRPPRRNFNERRRKLESAWEAQETGPFARARPYAGCSRWWPAT